jgi:hypothetical protein
VQPTPPPPPPRPAGPALPPTPAWAALASIGAGAIHAAAVGVHGDHRAAAWAFGLLAIAQIGWGVLALVRCHRWIAPAGMIVNGAAVAGWLLAKTTGVPFVAGLDTAEGPGFPDTVAALLAVAAIAGALASLADPRWLRGAGARAAQVPAAAAVTLLVLSGMVTTGGHSHAHGGDDPGHDMVGMDHGHDGTGTPDHDHGDPGPGGPGHDHGGGPGGHNPDDPGDPHEHPDTPDDPHDHPAPDDPHDHPDTPDDPHDHPAPDDPHDHPAPPVPTHPYTGELPVDLSGVPGVTAAEQHEAEALVTETILTLPQFADPADAEALGFRSIGDDSTGYVHYLNWPWIDDDHILDPHHPEALVYRLTYPGGVRTLTLQAAMYMLPTGTTLDEVPPFGGRLVQWHAHFNLCYAGEPNAWRVTSVVEPPAPCPAGQFRPDPVPMIHVWTVAQRCGPFAALEGIGGGEVRDGEAVNCDHVHGSS